jgi:hypothetical protein
MIEDLKVIVKMTLRLSGYTSERCLSFRQMTIEFSSKEDYG